MHSTGVDDGLAALEYFSGCQGNFASTSLTKLAPAGAPGEEKLARLFEYSMTLY